MTDTASRLAAALAGRYRILRALGAGGMATVYLAEDLKHRRQVAIKVLRPELAVMIGAERFLREIEVTAGLQHPHILPLFDSGEADGLLFYVMPFVAGESLRDRLDRLGPLPVAEALGIARDAAAALTFAHARGIVHRDIKPENILLEDGEALVADFGIALALVGVDDRLTATGLAVGTPAYMSPEQIAGVQNVDGRADVYSLACVLFEMLTGEPPFAGATAQAILGRSLSEAPRTASSLRPGLPTEIDAALTRALAKDPDHRFATPRELVEACAPPPVSGPRRRSVLAAGVVAAAAVLAVGWPLWRSARTAEARTLLPTIAELAEQGRYVEAYDLAVRAERRLAGDSALAGLFESVSDLLAVNSEPSGAAVQLQRIPGDGEPPTDSAVVGTTPLRDLRVARADYRIVLRLPGRAPAERIVSSAFARSEPDPETRGRRIALEVSLPADDSIPPDMVAVPGGRYHVVSPDLPTGLEAELLPFLIDRYEVTNAAYGEFLRSGAAPAEYRDRTGLPGPREWVSQEPPAGTARHPVTGVTWHEAAAFCAAAGKRLPTLYEWEKAARDGKISRFGVIMPWGYVSVLAGTDRRANFGSQGTAPVDSFPFGISPYGAYGMAGNVKEWLVNPAGAGYAVTGGSWQDPAYVFSELGGVPATAASPAIGFRCARTIGGGPGDQGAGPLPDDPPPPVYRPVDAATFRTFLTHYRYDRRPANPRGIQVVETPDWRRERFWIDGVGNDSILIYLYLPTRSSPPFQTLVSVPSAAAFFFEPAWRPTEHDLGPHIKGGRAVLLVLMTGMLERSAPGFEPPPPPSVGFRDLMVRHATELRLGIDYLETREEIDTDRLAYIGLSFGAGSRLPFAAVDQRFKSVVLIGAGIDERMQPTLPEAANFNFAPYIDAPKLVMNGRLDEEHPWLTRARPLWDLLREPKELVLVDGAGHHPPVEDRVPAINAFLDRTLGPVRPGR